MSDTLVELGEELSMNADVTDIFGTQPGDVLLLYSMYHDNWVLWIDVGSTVDIDPDSIEQWGC